MLLLGILITSITTTFTSSVPRYLIYLKPALEKLNFVLGIICGMYKTCQNGNLNKFDKVPYNKSNKALSSLLELQDTSLGLGEQVICARPDVEQCSRVKVDFRSVPSKKST